MLSTRIRLKEQVRAGLCRPMILDTGPLTNILLLHHNGEAYTTTIKHASVHDWALLETVETWEAIAKLLPTKWYHISRMIESHPCQALIISNNCHSTGWILQADTQVKLISVFLVHQGASAALRHLDCGERTYASRMLRDECTAITYREYPCHYWREMSRHSRLTTKDVTVLFVCILWQMVNARVSVSDPRSHNFVGSGFRVGPMR